jgi:hypothetical protein
MTRVWMTRLGGAFAVWAVVDAVSAAAGTDPQPLLLAALILIVGSIVWLATDLVDHAAPARWATASMSSRGRRAGDVRVGVLQRALADVATRQDVEQLHPLLVELVDDRLAARHGVDRRLDPTRAAAILGGELSDFVTTPPPPVRLGDARYLSHIVSGIERL